MRHPLYYRPPQGTLSVPLLPLDPLNSPWGVVQLGGGARLANLKPASLDQSQVVTIDSGDRNGHILLRSSRSYPVSARGAMATAPPDAFIQGGMAE